MGNEADECMGESVRFWDHGPRIRSIMGSETNERMGESVGFCVLATSSVVLAERLT